MQAVFHTKISDGWFLFHKTILLLLYRERTAKLCGQPTCEHHTAAGRKREKPALFAEALGKSRVIKRKAGGKRTECIGQRYPLHRLGKGKECAENLFPVLVRQPDKGARLSQKVRTKSSRLMKQGKRPAKSSDLFDPVKRLRLTCPVKTDPVKKSKLAVHGIVLWQGQSVPLRR